MSLAQRELEFLTESTRLKFLESPLVRARKGIQRFRNIPTIPYEALGEPNPNIGYAGVLTQLKLLAKGRQPLELDDIPKWQKQIVNEHKEYGFACDPSGVGKFRSEDVDYSDPKHGYLPAEDVRGSLYSWFRDMNHASLQGMLAPTFERPKVFVQFMTPLYFRFENISPFIGGNGCLGRLFLNYGALLMDMPLLIFRIEDREKFEQVSRNQRQFQKFVGHNIRSTERCTSCNQFVPWKQETGGVDYYACQQCRNIISVPRHSMLHSLR